MEIFHFRHVNCSHSTKVVYNDSAHLTSKYVFNGFCRGYYKNLNLLENYWYFKRSGVTQLTKT